MTETTVYVKDLRLHAFHGVLPQERLVGNDYVVNVTVEYPWLPATESDDVADTLNYATLTDIICSEMSVSSKLLEHVAGRLVEAICTEFPKTLGIRIDIRKVAPPISHDTDGCGVSLYVRY